MKKGKIFLSGLALILCQSIFAGNLTVNNKATATLNPSCVVSATNISFGTYNPQSGNSFSTGNIGLLCTKNTNVTVGINLNSTQSDVAAINTTFSMYYSANNQYYSRVMSDSQGHSLYYNLFQDSNHTLIFGGSDYFHLNSNAYVYLTTNGSLQNIPVYGAMGGNQYVVPGTYTDNISVTVTY